METKQSKIELLIDEIQDYIDSCKYKAFSNNIIMVNKDEMDSYLMELKKNVALYDSDSPKLETMPSLRHRRLLTRL